MIKIDFEIIWPYPEWPQNYPGEPQRPELSGMCTLQDNNGWAYPVTINVFWIIFYSPAMYYIVNTYIQKNNGSKIIM